LFEETFDVSTRAPTYARTNLNSDTTVTMKVLGVLLWASIAGLRKGSRTYVVCGYGPGNEI
jgi:hypothetical protein